jgi:hypothetical protein
LLRKQQFQLNSKVRHRTHKSLPSGRNLSQKNLVHAFKPIFTKFILKDYNYVVQMPGGDFIENLGLQLLHDILASLYVLGAGIAQSV